MNRLLLIAALTPFVSSAFAELPAGGGRPPVNPGANLLKYSFACTNGKTYTATGCPAAEKECIDAGGNLCRNFEGHLTNSGCVVSCGLVCDSGTPTYYSACSDGSTAYASDCVSAQNQCAKTGGAISSCTVGCMNNATSQCPSGEQSLLNPSGQVYCGTPCAFPLERGAGGVYYCPTNQQCIGAKGKINLPACSGITGGPNTSGPIIHDCETNQVTISAGFTGWDVGNAQDYNLVPLYNTYMKYLENGSNPKSLSPALMSKYQAFYSSGISQAKISYSPHLAHMPFQNLPPGGFVCLTDCHTIYCTDPSLAAEAQNGSFSAPNREETIIHELGHVNQCNAWGSRTNYAATWWGGLGLSAATQLAKIAESGFTQGSIDWNTIHNSMPMELPVELCAQYMCGGFYTNPTTKAIETTCPGWAVNTASGDSCYP